MRISKLGLLVLVSALLLLLLCSELKAAELHLELAKPNYDFSNYRVVIFSSDTGELIVNGTVASDAGNVRIPNMLPGTLFTVQIIAEFNNGTAAKFFKIFNTATVPEVPGGVRGQSETDNVLLEWEPPAIGQANTYIVNYGKSNDLEVGILGQVSLIKNATSPTRVDKLEPGSSYSFSIYAIFHNKSSQAATINVSTVPLPPESMGVLETTSSSALLSWRPPSVGSFDEFRLEYAGNLQLTGDLSMLIGDMMPGKMLTVSMATVSNGMLSDGVSYNVTARPLPVLNLQALALNTSAISLSWKVDMTSQQQYFVVTVANVVQQSKMDEQFKLQTIEHAAIVDRLPPGQQFTINVVAVSNNVSSDVSTALQATKPLQPIITALIPSADSFQLKWSPADGSTPSTSLSLLYGLVNNDLIYTREVSNAVSEVTVTGLTPGAVYQLNLTANSYGEKSEPLYKNISLVPLAPYDLHVPTANVTNSTMLVTWAFVDDDAAFINAFRVNVSSSSDGLEQTMVVTNTSRRSVIVRRLESGSEYKLSVESVAHNQYSDPITAVQATRPSTPRDMRLRFYTNTGLGVGWLAPYGNFDEYRVSYSGMDRNGNATLGKAAETFSFDNLTAGEEYVVSVSSYLNAFNLTSIPATIERRTRPLLESNFTQIEMSNTTVNVTVSPTKTGAFDYYIIRLVSFDTDKEKFLPRNASSLMVQFNKLSPGEPYEVTLAVKSGNIKSQDSRSLEFRTRPSDVELASVNSSVTEKSIALVWKPPDAGKYDMFDLQYRIVRGSRKFMNITTKQPSVQITNLKPFQSYEFALYVRSWQQRSEGISFKLKTKEGSPDAVQMFRISNTKATDITLNWEAPLNTNGIISGYTITYNGFSACNFTDYGRHEYAGGNVSYSPTVTGLMPATEYNVTIQAETTSRAGEKGYVVVKTKLAAPALQNRNAAPMPIQGSTTTKSFSVLLKRSWFSDCHGKITNFAIIVAQDPTYNSSGTNLLKWSQVKDTKLWKAYQATPINFNPFHYTDEFNFTIGSEDCTNNPLYCNGPLQSKTEYYVKFRAFTAENMYTDTAYSSPISTLGNYVGIIAGAVVGSLLVILLLVLVVVQRRRLQCCRKTSANDKNASGSFVTHVASQGMANSPLYACSRSVKLSEFVQHVKIMGADSDFRFSEEYEALKMVGREQPSTAADLPVNRGKNRFTNILPYDHSRVKLIPVDDEDGSDYINANYMPGFNSPREYIVTQGPLPSTRDDFWRMVWEQNTRSIVMLTRCIEKGREKCDHYWPIDSEQTYYGEIQVAVLNESKYPYWTISEFKVTLDMESRVVRHFHFTAWPDFGVPEHTQTLIKFVRAMRDRAQYSPHPIIAHCSAGVGRSGTFIVIDRLIQLIKQSDTVDIFGNVYEMRKERVWMVQTEQQYICIHNSLRTVLEGREDDMPTHEYDDLGLDNKAYDDDEGIVESGM